MELSAILGYITQFGVFGVLFIWLLTKQMKESREREKAMQATLDKFADTVVDKLEKVDGEVEDIKEDIKDIKNKIN
jgi:sensor c-di-GMP phosphodiesterase-like protein